MDVPVGLSVYSGLADQTMPYLDQTATPFESLWFPDHVQYGGKDVAEGWSLMMYALARYPDKFCGHQVMCNSFRNPAHLAKMGATAQALSSGRFVLGIGAGWNEEEYHAYGWPFPGARVRIEQLSEAVQIVRTMWSDSPAQFRGIHYEVANAYCEPLPDPVPPVMIGGSGEKYLLRVVAEQADWWNYIFLDRAAYSHKQEVLQRHCRDVGRDYDEITQVIATQLLIGETEEDLRLMQERTDVRSIANNGFAGTPEMVTETLLAAIDQGAQRLIVGFADSPRTDGAQLFVDRVLGDLVAQAGQ